MTWERLLLYLALALVLMGTVRAARAKGQNPWLWGGLCFGLAAIPGLKLLALIPMIVLMFMKAPQQQNGSIAKSNSCPRCQSALVRNARYCTACGWDLAERYEPEAAPPEAVPPEALPEEREAATVAAPAPVLEGREPDPVSGQPPGTPADDPAPAEAAPEASPPPFTPPKKPVNLVPPTAAGMTERGVTLFNQGRVQESIDQFTKAIALDPNYIEAWARRAEAYAQLGRGNEAAEDRRRLDALNAG